MAQLTKAAYDALYNNVAGSFPAQTTKNITPAVMNQFAKDTEDSVPFLADGAPTGAKVTISSAEILAAYATPKQLVAAQGANKVILPIGVLFRLTYNTIAYATNTTVALGYDSGTAGTILTVASKAGFLNQASNFSMWVSIPNISGSDSQTINSISAYVNKNFCFSVATGNPTAGNSTIMVHLIYSVLDVS